jgi:hypothetical protein
MAVAVTAAARPSERPSSERASGVHSASAAASGAPPTTIAR